jgi:IS4 transposase
MKGAPRKVFDEKVREHGSDRYSKGFDSWSQLVAMVYGHLSGASSLRMIEAGYSSQLTQHYHLGTGVVHRSTMADANSKRSPEPFVALAQALMTQVARPLRQQGQQMLYLLDSTSITLKGRHFDAWTAANRTRNTQGIKLHVLYDLGAQAPIQHSFTAANVNDVTEGARLPIQADAIYVFDKGYCDYNWWADIGAQGATFVTRFKYNAALAIEQVRPIDAADQDTILADEIVRFANKSPGGKRRNRYEAPLRRITVARPDAAKPLVLATNDLEASASTIAQYYKDRWNIELFFKWIKQHLKIKQLFGRSENAVKIQILCALIAYLLLAVYRKAHGVSASLWALLSELRGALFQRPTTEMQVHRRQHQRRTEMKRVQLSLFF